MTSTDIKGAIVLLSGVAFVIYGWVAIMAEVMP